MGKEDKFLLVMEQLINEYLKDISKILQQKNNIEDMQERVSSKVKELKKAIDNKIEQSIQDIKEEEKRDKIRQNMKKHIEYVIRKREARIKKEQEEQMWAQRDQAQRDNEKEADKWVEKEYWEKRRVEIKEIEEQKKQREKAEKIKSNAEKDLAKCDKIFSKIENGYKDLIADDSFYLDIKEKLIQDHTAEELEKVLVGKSFTGIYRCLAKKFNIVSEEDKEKQIERYKKIKERTELIQKQPYRVINSEIQLSIYFDMIESNYEGRLPNAYIKEKEYMIKNYSEENTYIMPKDILSYFKKVLDRLENNEQFPKEYSQEAKELKTAIDGIKKRRAKLENTEQKNEIHKEEKKETIKQKEQPSKKSILRNLYESTKTKITSMFKKNKIQYFPLEYGKNNKFKERIGIGAPTQKKQAQNSRKYINNNKHKTTANRNSTIHRNSNIR